MNKAAKVGRPPMYRKVQGRFTVTLPITLERYLRKLGDRNLSQGIRTAAKALRKRDAVQTKYKDRS